MRTLDHWRCVSTPRCERASSKVTSTCQRAAKPVAVAQGIAQVPPDAQQDNVGLEMTPFKWVLGIHGAGAGG